MGLRGAFGLGIWSAYSVRLSLRALHLLQLEGYDTRRFLLLSITRRWWTSPPRATLAALSLLLALMSARCRPPISIIAEGLWIAFGGWLFRDARAPAAKKPLVMTARAKRLFAGQVVVAALPAIVSWRRQGRPWPVMWIATVATTLSIPLVTAAANLLLWPVEESFRRYYLRDARRILENYQPTVVAIAGSYGKTSTKEFLSTILTRRWSVLRPPGSFNTPMGLSRTIREQLRPDHDVFVTELGDYVPGDIRFLCDLVRPRIGVLTTIGPEHLERFKTMDRVVQAKQELLESLPRGGVAIVNQDDPLVRPLGDRAEQRGVRVVRYGLNEPGARIRACNVRTTRQGLEFDVVADGSGEATFRVGVLGRHNVSNILAAVAAGLELGMTLSEIADAARHIAPVEHRLQPIKGSGDVLVIDDAFNSNPRGAAEALQVLRDLEGQRRVLVTPGMIELADREFEENRTFGRLAAEVCDEVILVGQERAKPLLAGLREARFPERNMHVVSDLSAANQRLATLVRPGDIVLFENDLPDTYESMGDSVVRNGVTANHRPPTPAHSEEMLTLAVNGVRIAYLDTGPPSDAKTPVVVLHGWGASSRAMDSVRRCLESQWRTIVPDLPGFGASERPRDAWSSADYAAIVSAFIRQQGLDKVVLIGHSLGGKIASLIAASEPDLVQQLILIDSAGIRPRHGPIYQARVLGFKATRMLAAHAPGEFQNWLQHQFGSADYQQAGDLRQTLVRVVNEDIRDILPGISAPTLLIWGELDDDTPLSDGRIMERLIPDSGLVVFAGAGHFAYADDAGRFCRVVTNFLNAQA